MSMEEIENSYATKDLYFAAYLYVKKVNLKKLEKYSGDRNHAYFIFDDKEKCSQLEIPFWEGRGDAVMVNIKEYTNALRSLRTRAFSIDRIIQETEGTLKYD